MAFFLSEAVEASLCYFFENWMMKVKYPKLRIIQIPSNTILQAYFYLSDPNYFWRFNMRYPVLSKFIYSEKATKFCEISTFLLSNVVPVKSKVKISHNFVAFSEYMNFKFTFKSFGFCSFHFVIFFLISGIGFIFSGALHVFIETNSFNTALLGLSRASKVDHIFTVFAVTTFFCQTVFASMTSVITWCL